jgi:hypothetical protein
VLKLGGCTGGTTSTLPTGYQREPSLGSQVSMLLLAVPAIVLPTGLTRRSAATSAVSQPNQPLSSAASRPELVRHPTCTSLRYYYFTLMLILSKIVTLSYTTAKSCACQRRIFSRCVHCDACYRRCVSCGSWLAVARILR